MPRAFPEQLAELADRQAGAVGRRQLLAAGVTAKQLEVALGSGRWRRARPGVYLTFTGPAPDLTRLWCALLYCGDGAVASHSSAMWLHDGRDPLPRLIEIAVPHERRVRRAPGIVVRRRRGLAATQAGVPRTRIDVTVLDLAEQARTPERAVDPVLRAIQRRLTRPERLRAELAGRPRHRWRPLLRDVLAEADQGVTTPLELRYAADVERAHGLPRADRNRTEGRPGKHRYVDNRYDALLVEVDGKEAHPPEDDHLDRRRDNASTLRREDTLRYGWREVAGDPCRTAAEVAQALADRGWPGRPRRCGPTCHLDPGQPSA